MAQKSIDDLTRQDTTVTSGDLFIFQRGVYGYKLDADDLLTQLDARYPTSVKTIIEITSSTQLSSIHNNALLVITGSNDIDITVPSEATDDLGKGFSVDIRHDGTGILTFVEDTGVTIVPPTDGTLESPINGSTNLTYPALTLNRWMLSGQTLPA